MKIFLYVFSKFYFGDHKQELGAELRHLTSEPVQTDCTKVVYLVRAQLDLMKSICSQIHHDTSKGIQREYFLYFVPRRAVVCEKVCFPVLAYVGIISRLRSWCILSPTLCAIQILEEEKVHHLLTIGEYPLYLLPLDDDVLSFELDTAYRVCLVLVSSLAFRIFYTSL